MGDEPKFPRAIEEGSIWCWEPLKPELACRVRVLDSEWSGKEWYIEIEALEDAGHMWKGMRTWYYLDHFVEVCVLTDSSKDFLER